MNYRLHCTVYMYVVLLVLHFLSYFSNNNNTFLEMQKPRNVCVHMWGWVACKCLHQYTLGDVKQVESRVLYIKVYNKCASSKYTSVIHVSVSCTHKRIMSV